MTKLRVLPILAPVRSRDDLTPKTQETLHHMATKIPKYNTRSYATVICIENGSAVWTDGFALVRWENSDLHGVSEYLTRNMFRAKGKISYPQWEHTVKPGSFQVVGKELLAVIKGYRKPQNRAQDCYGCIAEDGSVSMQLRGSATGKFFFEPKTLADALKLVPKDATIEDFPTVLDENTLVIHFSTNNWMERGWTVVGTIKKLDS